MTAPEERDPKLVAEWVVDHATAKDPRLNGSRSERIRAIASALKLADMRVTAAEGIRGVDKHYRQHNAEPLTSDGLLAQVRRSRQAIALAAQVNLPRSPEVEEAGERLVERARDDAARALPRGYGDAWTEEQAIAVRSWDCPDCKAAGGDPCVNRSTGELFQGGRTFHPRRVRLAYPTGTQ